MGSLPLPRIRAIVEMLQEKYSDIDPKTYGVNNVEAILYDDAGKARLARNFLRLGEPAHLGALIKESIALAETREASLFTRYDSFEETLILALLMEDLGQSIQEVTQMVGITKLDDFIPATLKSGKLQCKMVSYDKQGLHIILLSTSFPIFLNQACKISIPWFISQSGDFYSQEQAACSQGFINQHDLQYFANLISCTVGIAKVFVARVFSLHPKYDETVYKAVRIMELFLIAHEIAHGLLRHSRTTTVKTDEKYNAEELKADTLAIEMTLRSETGSQMKPNDVIWCVILLFSWLNVLQRASLLIAEFQEMQFNRIYNGIDPITRIINLVEYVEANDRDKGECVFADVRDKGTEILRILTFNFYVMNRRFKLKL